MEANFQGRMYYDLIWAVITRMDKILSRCPFKICVLYCIMDTILKSLWESKFFLTSEGAGE